MSTKGNQYRIPHRVNAPMSIAFWNADQIVPVFVAIGVGSVLKMMSYAVVFAILYFVVVGSLKEKYPRGFVKHKLWSLGLFPLDNSASMPDPTKKEYYQ
ncbi:MAG: type IV conjugative transfer system protein TraL [Paraglaciecola sp.]|jgi:type IV conjugative transfer system protein TraL